MFQCFNAFVDLPSIFSSDFLPKAFPLLFESKPQPDQKEGAHANDVHRCPFVLAPIVDSRVRLSSVRTVCNDCQLAACAFKTFDDSGGGGR